MGTTFEHFTAIDIHMTIKYKKRGSKSLGISKMEIEITINWNDPKYVYIIYLYCYWNDSEI